MASELSSFYQDFQQFALENNILASTAGFTIGLATKDLIDKTVRRFSFLWEFPAFKKMAKSIEPTTPIGISCAILGDIFLWLFAIFLTFLIATYVMTLFVKPILPAVPASNKHEQLTPNTQPAIFM